MSLLVVDPGHLTLVQDAGRPGLGDQGVGPSGAFDRGAMRQLHALLGDTEAAAVLEVLAGGLRLRAEADHLLAVTGGIGSVHVDGEHIEHGRAFVAHEGQEVRLGPVELGLRAYVGVAGGIDVEPVLGSRSADTMSGLGPPRLAEGDVLEVGPPAHAAEVEDVPALLTSGETTVPAIPGPRDDWFTDDAVRTFFSAAWTVSSRSDRIGVRLEGSELERLASDELPSEPCVRGSVQVVSAGQPVVLGPDHPVTGGYPVIAVVLDAHVDRLAQVRPGDIVRFTRKHSG
ncbi:biotin-dependent carboxyltransferase family protein [Aeromicrobium sp.]|uniref:5-oxoprolinase subunit C family protein n=1 Tax=Aeromicrobium sp. TaxID=1871063 RepID=UPI003D6AD593